MVGKRETGFVFEYFGDKIVYKHNLIACISTNDSIRTTLQLLDEIADDMEKVEKILEKRVLNGKII